MKILQITNKTPVPARDGGSIATFRLSCGLVKLGHSVTVLAMNTRKHYIEKDLWEPLARKAGFDLIPVDINSNARLLGAMQNFFFSKLPYTGTRFKTSDFRKRLTKILSSQEFDIIIIENLYPFLYLKDIKNNSRAKIVMRAHNLEHEIWQRTAANSVGVKGIYLHNLAKRIKNLELNLMNEYDFLAPITQRDLDQFNYLGNLKPAVALPTGINMDESCTSIKLERSHEIAHLGALDWAPNQEGILWFLEKVWPLVLQSHPKAKFHIAGRNAPLWFQKKIAQDRVQYHGEIESAHDFICHFPIHIVPLWSGSGMRIKIIEAMARGRIIVTTPIGVEGIEAKDNKSLIIRSNPDEFASSIDELINNHSLLNEISQNAFTFVKENFENTKLVDRFIGFLRENDISS